MALIIRDNGQEKHVINAHDPEQDLEEMKKRRAMDYIKTLRRQCIGFLWSQFYGDMHKLSSIGNKFTVFRTTYRSGGPEKIAIKIKEAGDEKHLFHFAQEALILREVVHDHPNIISLLGVRINKLNTLYIEMEYHPTTVNAMLNLQERAATPAQIQYICRDVLKALYYCHKHRVLHADIKEQNLLIAKDNRIVLADFDSSIVMPKPPQAIVSYAVCPLGYRPLEVCLLHPITFAADIWALGCTITDMCRPDHPVFYGNTLQKQVDIIHSFGGPIPDAIFVDNSKSDKKLVKPTGPVHGFENVFHFVPTVVRPFLRRLLTLNPLRRPKAVVALNDPFFFFNLEED